VAAERDEEKRKAFRQAVDEIGGVAAADDLVFLDEAGMSLSMSVLYGWGKRGEPLTEAVPAKRGKNLSILGALDKEGMVAAIGKQGAMKRADIERFLRVDLLPRLEPGAVLVMDPQVCGCGQCHHPQGR
jgi:hypothetical protein